MLYIVTYPPAALAVVNNTVVCRPVNCVSVYGMLRPVFNSQTRLCAAQPSQLPSPSRGALPNNGSGAPSTLSCVHGAIVCLASCTCECADGWVTTVDASTVFDLVYCNTTTPLGVGPGGVVGQTSSTASCNSVIECFFVFQLPYALVSSVA